MKIKGIDVSKWQGVVDFEKVRAAGYEFVIINAGYGRNISQKDKYFEDNYRKAKAAGLGVGAYWYSYATTAEDAKKEAQVFIEAVKGKTFDYPLCYDIEDSKQNVLPNATIGEMVKAFCGHLESKGYYAALYSYASFLSSKIPVECRRKYDVWVAHFDVSKPTYNGTYGMWQYSSTGKVNGVSGNVDLDYAYKDYPKLIKGAGLNGYPKPSDTKPAPKRGDVNGDGKVNVTDVSLLAAHVKGTKPLEDPSAADVNGDGKVNVTDLSEVAAEVKGKK